MEEYASAAKELNALNWVGMEDNEDYGKIVAQNPDTVRIIKPFADHGRIREEIDYAVEHGSVAVGIDIDHVPGTDGLYDVVDGIPMGPVFSKDLADFVAYAKLPLWQRACFPFMDALRQRKQAVPHCSFSPSRQTPFGIAPLQIYRKFKEAFTG